MRLTALLEDRFVAIDWFAAAMLVICSHWEKERICPIMSWSSMGFIGSWCDSWATKSLRKSSLPSSPFDEDLGFISSSVRMWLGSVLIVVMAVVVRQGRPRAAHRAAR